jgi:hypothetical protein
MDKPIYFEMNSKDKLKYLEKKVKNAKNEMIKFKHTKNLKIPIIIINEKTIVKFD